MHQNPNTQIKRPLTVFGALLKQSGMSHNEAGWWLGLGKGTVSNYCYTNNAPAKHIRSLAKIVAKQSRDADALSRRIIDEFIQSGEPIKGAFVLRYSRDDVSASGRGYPFASAHNTMLEMVVAGLPLRVAKIIQFKPIPKGAKGEAMAPEDDLSIF